MAFLDTNTYAGVSAYDFIKYGGSAPTLAQNMLSQFYEGAHAQFKDANGNKMFK